MGNSNSTDVDYKPGPTVEAEEFVRGNYAKPGDIIWFKRGAYCHCAIYVGDGYVINVPAESKNDKSCIVTREKLVDVANKVPGKTKVYAHNVKREAELLKYRYNIKKCDLNRSVQTQLDAARKMVGKRVEYNFLIKNCEHFATECKYGYGFSSQSPLDNRYSLNTTDLTLRLIFPDRELPVESWQLTNVLATFQNATPRFGFW